MPIARGDREFDAMVARRIKECVACLDAAGFGETAIPHTCGKSECTCRFNAEGVLLDVLGCEVHDSEGAATDA